MSANKFKTLRHIEAVRNYLSEVIREILLRQENHDQTKLQSPEVEVFEEYTPKLKNCTYGSEEYLRYMKEMKTAITHHHLYNRHHPEYFAKGFQDMNLIDLIEMLCDWKAATLRHNDGDIYKSLEINKKRFNFSDDMLHILKNTIDWIESKKVKHNADES